jgi:lipid A 3-O-deacylase
MKISRTRFPFFSAILGLCLVSTQVAAEESRLSLIVQNDLFVGRDGGGYTSGIALSHLRSVSPGETSIRVPGVLAAFAPMVGVGPATLGTITVAQMMATPNDITRKLPDPADVPYVGALWIDVGQVSVRDDVADMFSLKLGALGPAAGGRRTQTLIHRIIGADRPQGWDTQGPNRLLVGVERYRAWRFASGVDDQVRPLADAIVLTGVTLGSWQSSVGATVLLRYGTGLKRSYPTALRQGLRSGDPVVLGTGWFVYAGLHADRIFSHAGIGSARYAQESTAELRQAQSVAVAGLAYGFRQGALSFSLQSASPLTTSIDSRHPYGSLTYTMPW